jgi:protein-S-isoprenylcysteine O-methyltransferase Ste14
MNRFYVIAQFALIIAFGAAVFVGPQAVAVPDALRWGGLAICVMGIAIIAAALQAMGRVMQVSPEPKGDGHLVTRGIYGRLRHPMYTGMTWIAIGLAMRQPTLPVAIAGVLLVALLLVKSRYEERLLAARYPDYAAYRARTWGVLPPLR